MRNQKGFMSVVAALSLACIMGVLLLLTGCFGNTGATAGHAKACFYDVEGIKADYDGMNGLMRTAKEDPKKANEHMKYRIEQGKQETYRAKIKNFWQNISTPSSELEEAPEATK